MRMNGSALCRIPTCAGNSSSSSTRCVDLFPSGCRCWLSMQDERRPAVEEIEERGQTRAADWPKSFPGEKFTLDMIPTPEERWKWVALATVEDLQPNDHNTT